MFNKLGEHVADPFRIAASAELTETFFDTVRDRDFTAGITEHEE